MRPITLHTLRGTRVLRGSKLATDLHALGRYAAASAYWKRAARSFEVARLASARPYEYPYYRAAFILLGDPF